MHKFITLLSSLCLSFFALANVYAAEYPAEIQGKWVTSSESCPNGNLEIDKKFAVMGTEQTCEAKSIKKNNDKFLIREVCNGEGGSAVENSTYSISGNTLIRSYRKFSDKYMRCGTVAAVAKTTNNSAMAQTCSLAPGSAGVTTFLDEKLKKSGNTIRDFDGYVFKAEKKIKVNKSDVLVGKLIRNDGSVSEMKSYAFAEEWICK